MWKEGIKRYVLFMSLFLKEYGLALLVHFYQPPSLTVTEFNSIMKCDEYA